MVQASAWAALCVGGEVGKWRESRSRVGVMWLTGPQAVIRCTNLAVVTDQDGKLKATFDSSPLSYTDIQLPSPIN